MIRRLAPEIIEDLKLELIPPGSGPTLARLPPCNQSDFSAAIQIHQLSAKEIRNLADLWCKANDQGTKHFLLKSPEEALDKKQDLKLRKKPSSACGNLSPLLRTKWKFE